MTVEKFLAETQYPDWVGTAAAENDVDSPHSIYSILKEQKRIGDDDRLVAVRLYFADRTEPGVRVPTIEAIVVALPPGEDLKEYLAITDPIPVRKLEHTITLQQFFDLHRRFDLVLTRGNLNIEGRRYEYEDS